MIKKFLVDLWKERSIIWELSKNDCKARFAASGLGVIWAFLQPLMTIMVFWVVFQVGVKSPPVGDVPFMVWYVPAYLSWVYFSEGLMQVTNSLLEYKYLVKKVNFKVSVIPLIKVLSAGVVHAVFLVVIIIINLLYGRTPNVFYIQCLYYFGCMFVLLTGLGWLLSAIAAFLTDVSNVVGVLVQVGFWATPIFWDAATMGAKVQNILKLNPMYYVCTGYRDSFVNNVWFWEKPGETIYFWLFSISMLILGICMFEKMKPHFDDVL